MGGVSIQENGKSPRSLGDEEFHQLIADGLLTFPDITLKDVKDRSKGDALAKGLVLLQTTWFIVQCIARGTKPGLAVTELEVVTLALATLNGAIYFFWWNKPLDVQSPVRLLMTSGHTASNQLSSSDNPAEEQIVIIIQAPATDLEPGESTNTSSQTIQNQETETTTVPSMLPLSPDVIPRSNDSKLDDQDRSRQSLSSCLPLRTVYKGFSEMACCNKVPSNATRIPTFYAPAAHNDKDDPVFVAIPLLGAAFGAIHCIAWNLHFPSTYERVLWRISTTFIVVFPLSIFVVLFVVIHYYEKKFEQATWKKIAIFWGVVSIFGFVPYIIARLCLLVLAFTSLRHLPPEAYQDIQWTSYIPHI